MEGCLDCGRGFCELCGECSCCNGTAANFVGIGTTQSSIDNRSSMVDEREGKTNKGPGRPKKDNADDIKDKHSTGRKRAAVLFPLSSNGPCEWQKLSNCGGGKHPVIGCFEGKQQHRHHGPDKNPLKNEPGNVHRICDDCHNIWHSQNNKDYDPNIPHSPRKATDKELIARITKARYCADESPKS